MVAPEALYVHVPFCTRICPYCSFNVTSRFDGPGLDRFLSVLAREIDGLEPQGRLPLRTVYVGGGTPTVFDPDSLGRLLESIRRRCQPGTLIEWTVEANPDSLDRDKAVAMKAAGISRVSIGAQSMRPRLLKRLGRTHGPDDVRRSVEHLRTAGFERINADLIYGQPEQSVEDWVEDLDEVLDLGVSHVSLYELTFEAGTPFGRAAARGSMARADDGLALEMFSLARERLASRGLEWYEISNFAVPGHESEHNRIYWRNEPYYGVGPGAFGCVSGVRTMNVRDVSEWSQRVDATGSGVEERDSLTPRDTFLETLACGLRTREGVDLAALRRRTGLDFDERERRRIAELAATGLAELDGDRLRLTLAGVVVLDSILLDFIPVPFPHAQCR